MTGAEVVDLENATEERKPVVKGRKRKRNDSEGSESDEWSDVVHSSDDEDEDDDEDEEDAVDENGVKVPSKKSDYLTLEEKAKKAAEVTANRLLTDADFKRIDAAQLKKQVQGYRKGGKRRKVDTYDTDEPTLASGRREELVDLVRLFEI